MLNGIENKYIYGASWHYRTRELIHRPHTVLVIPIVLGYLKDSNAAAHSVDYTGISEAVRLKRIENDIECPIYMLESTRIITISL